MPVRGSPCRRCAIEGNAPGTLALAEAQLGFAAGQPYDRPRVAARIASYIANLRRRGYYEAQGDHALQNVSDDGRSAELVVHIDGGARIIVQFEGDPVPPKVRADLVPIEREASVDEDLLEDAARALAEHFRAQGYRDAEVTYTPQPGRGRARDRVPRGARAAVPRRPRRDLRQREPSAHDDSAAGPRARRGAVRRSRSSIPTSRRS